MSASNPKQQERDPIERLAEYVDEKFSKKAKFMGLRRFLVRNFINLVIIGYFIAILMMFIFYISDIAKIISANIPNLKTDTTLALSLALVASFISVMNLFVGVLRVIKPATLNDDVITYNFDLLKKPIVEDELPLLKALIIMKTKNPELTLKSIIKTYDLKSDRKKLFDIIYFVDTNNTDDRHAVAT
jgi:hypothetical protein